MKNTAFSIYFFFAFLTLSGQNTSITENLEKSFTSDHFSKIEHVMKFNKDTILVSGYLYSEESKLKNAVYLTNNGGLNWTRFHFNGDAWIYDTHFEKDGKIWMGGSDHHVHFSDDYGKTWKKGPKPFIPSDRIYKIYMQDSLNGVAGGLSNRIAVTHDNWKTMQQIPTPLDQKKFSISEHSSMDRVEKVQILDSVILVNQNDHIYFSNINKINWKEFNVPVSDFEVKKIHRTVNIFGLNNRIYILNPDLTFKETKLYNEEPWDKPIYEKNASLELTSFLNSPLKTIKIEAGKFVPDGVSGGCIRKNIFKKNVQLFTWTNKDKLETFKNILETNHRYYKPTLGIFEFTKTDIEDYFTFYKMKVNEHKKAKTLGSDYSNQIKLNHSYFSEPLPVLENLTQEMIIAAYNNIKPNPFSEKNEPYLKIEIINEKDEVITINSEESPLFSLPLNVHYKGNTIQTYDIRIPRLLKNWMMPSSNFYEKLSGGELIFRLIEEKIITELEYKNEN